MPSTIPANPHNMEHVRQAFDATKRELSSILPIEGTWTPVVRGTGTAGAHTYSAQAGVYIKIGRIVHFNLVVILTAKDGAMAGGIQVTLPLTSNNDGVNSNAVVGRVKNVDLSAGYTQYAAQVDAAAASLQIYQHGDNVDSSVLQAAALANDSRLYISGFYFTAS